MFGGLSAPLGTGISFAASSKRLASKQNIAAAVPRADVVITNPTHYAVALEYQQDTMPGPMVIAKGADYPTLSISGGLSTQYSEAYPNSFADQFKNNYYYSLSLRLAIPIFNGWQTRTNIRNSKLNVRNSELQLQQAKNTLYKEIQQAEVDAEAALQRYHASQKNVTALQESFRYVEQKFGVGMVSTTDYNVAKKNLAQSQSELVQAKYQYIFQSKILEFYQGIPLSL